MNPTITGDTANGRSMSAESSAFPRKSRRTIRSAMVIPKIVFSGTVISVILSVSSRAATASGVVSASHTGARPPEKVWATMIPTGTISRQRQVGQGDEPESEPNDHASRSIAAGR